MSRTLLTLCIFLTTLTSCADSIRYMDRIGEKGPIPKLSHSKNCQNSFGTQDENYISNSFSAGPLATIFTNDRDIQKLSPFEKGALWTMLHLNLRPDIVTPDSYIQISILKDGKLDTILDPINSGDSTGLLIQTLNDLLKKDRSIPLSKLAKMLDQKIPETIPIDREFASFLKNNRGELENDSDWVKTFFRAQQVIQENEHLNRLSYEKIITQSLAQTPPTKNRELLFSFKKGNIEANCNKDLSLYEKKIYPIFSKQPLPLFLSYINKDFQFYISIGSATKYPLSKSKWGLPFFQTTHDESFFRPICYVKQLEHDFFIMGKGARDSAQFIFQLISNMQSTDIETSLNSARYYYSSNSHRYLYESQRKPESSNVAPTSFDHVDSLGEIWVHEKSPNGYSRIFIDDRANFSTSNCRKIN